MDNPWCIRADIDGERRFEDSVKLRRVINNDADGVSGCIRPASLPTSMAMSSMRSGPTTSSNDAGLQSLRAYYFFPGRLSTFSAPSTVLRWFCLHSTHVFQRRLSPTNSRAACPTVYTNHHIYVVYWYTTNVRPYRARVYTSMKHHVLL